MPNHEYTQEARRLITERCLIAADIDRTILDQAQGSERRHFLERIGPELLTAASYGTKLAFLTGNSMHELCSRILRWLTDQLCHTQRLNFIGQFHFFGNSGGVYAHIPAEDEAIQALLHEGNSCDSLAERAFEAITLRTNDERERAIRPRFVDRVYVESCRIDEPDTDRIRQILDEAGRRYVSKFDAKRATYETKYDLSSLITKDGITLPAVDPRIIEYQVEGRTKTATVQMTLKPVLSFRHARDFRRLWGKDLRRGVVADVQRRLDEEGLGHYVARAGGRSSIDVTQEKLDKAYALEFLIDRLNLRGQSRLGQKLGSNAIYLGDEVIVGGGNDYPVTRIPGLLVFAVNPEKELVPFLSHVFVPSAVMEGVDATWEVLSEYNRCAHRLLTGFDSGQPGRRRARPRTTVEALKEEIFCARITEKVSDLRRSSRTSVEDWQTLHALVTLMCRDDPAARQWLSMLIDELDMIMTELSARRIATQPAIGTSHPDA